jgi:hypothetical protein
LSFQDFKVKNPRSRNNLLSTIFFLFSVHLCRKKAVEMDKIIISNNCLFRNLYSALSLEGHQLFNEGNFPREIIIFSIDSQNVIIHFLLLTKKMKMRSFRNLVEAHKSYNNLNPEDISILSYCLWIFLFPLLCFTCLSSKKQLQVKKRAQLGFLFVKYFAGSNCYNLMLQHFPSQAGHKSNQFLHFILTYTL